MCVDRLDNWEWGIDPVEGFTVNNTRRFINSKNLEKRVHETRWYKFVPNKLNILVWRTILDRLPTRNNLVIRGIYLNFVLFPLCFVQIEDYKRVFVECDVVKEIWRKVLKWLDLHFPLFTNFSEIMK